MALSRSTAWIVPFLICLLEVINTPAADAVPVKASTASPRVTSFVRWFMVARTGEPDEKFERISIELLRRSTRPCHMTSDLDLARAAQTGDIAALGLLLERHRAALYAHALTIVGHGANAQDAVQDTFLIAVRKIGELRDPERVEGWLHTVLRSVCLTQLRGRRADAELPEVVAGRADLTPEAAIEALVMRDWVWTAIGRLSEPLRVVMMLRHFSACTAYDDIAAVCGIPVGTVRSRLAEGRSRLASELLATAERAHVDAGAQQAAEHQRLATAFAAFDAGRSDDLLDGVTPDVTVRFPSGNEFSGRDLFRAGIEGDAEDGVQVDLIGTVAGPGITILEARFHNPAFDPFHCPPATTQVHFKDPDGLTERMAFYYAPRPERQPQRRHLAPDERTVLLI